LYNFQFKEEHDFFKTVRLCCNGQNKIEVNKRRLIRLKVKDIMTKSVAYVDPNSTVVDAAKLMQQHNVGSIPVMDQNGIKGIITDRDIVVRNIAGDKDPKSTPVRDVMTAQVTTASPDMDVNQLSSMMSNQQVRRMPVLENNKLVGIVALGDMATNNWADSEAAEALTEISKPSKPM
jgi:CBS domain-containing protein